MRPFYGALQSINSWSVTHSLICKSRQVDGFINIAQRQSLWQDSMFSHTVTCFHFNTVHAILTFLALVIASKIIIKTQNKKKVSNKSHFESVSSTGFYNKCLQSFINTPLSGICSQETDQSNGLQAQRAVNNGQNYGP